MIRQENGAGGLYMGRALYSPASPMYYHSNGFPTKYSLQTFFHNRKLKHRVEQIRKEEGNRKPFDFLEAKTRIMEAEKAQWSFAVKNYHRPTKTGNKNRRISTEAVEKVPELSIEKEPIRCKTECQRARPSSHNDYSMKVTKKRIKSQNSMSPGSRSLHLCSPAHEKSYMMTEPLGETSQFLSALGRKISHKPAQPRKKLTYQISTSSKRSYRSEQRIKGWEVKQKEEEDQPGPQNK